MNHRLVRTMNKPIKLVVSVAGILLVLAWATWLGSIALESRALRMVAFGAFVGGLCVSLVPLVAGASVLLVERMFDWYRRKR
jgi:hypothetical protein